MRDLLIIVDGNIIVETDGHCFNKGVACSSIFTQEGLERYNGILEFTDNSLIIKGDLVLDENTAIIPYANYYATKGCVVACDARPSLNINSWKDRNKEIIDKLEIQIPDDCKKYLYNGFYLSLCSSLELALMDLLLIKITTSPVYYENAVNYWMIATKVRVKTHNIDEYFYQVLKYFTNNIVYHRFDKVANIYKEILKVDFPDYEQLSVYFRKRNNIVHRYSISNLDRIRITNAQESDIKSLYKEVDSFLSCLENSIKEVDT